MVDILKGVKYVNYTWIINSINTMAERRKIVTWIKKKVIII